MMELRLDLIDYLIALLFGIVEGITEWLPVSSTGHMIILNEFCELNVSEEFFELYLVVIQLGAVMAVVFLFWKDIWPFGIKNNDSPLSSEGVGRIICKNKFVMWFKILVACVPAAIVGVLFGDKLDELFFNYVVVSIALIVFGIAFIIVENTVSSKESMVADVKEITYPMAFVIGVFQLIAAVFPGTSRSGSTIVGSLAIGIKRSAAARFTFYMAVPVMLGASLIKIVSYEGSVSRDELVLLLFEMISAFAVSFVVIRKLLTYIRKHDFKPFGVYRIVLGIIVLSLGITGIIG